MNLSDLPSSIIEFFTPEKYARIPEYERQHLSNLRQNFEFLRSAGLTVQPPEFMLRNKSKKKKRKCVSRLTTDSSEGSDAEWTPAIEASSNKKGKNRKTIWPVLKSITKTCSSVSKTAPSTSVHKKAKKSRQIKTNAPETEIHVYSLRIKSRKSYMSLKIPDDDEYLYCEECNLDFSGDCPTHGALLHVNDTEVPYTCCWGVDPDYCRKTLPSGLVIKKSRIPGAGLGIFATKDFPSRTRFGPYEGKKEKDEEVAEKSGYCWQIYKDGKLSHFVDARDPRMSNWMRFVNCARYEEEQCVTAYQHQGQIYYRAHRHISAGTEILVYYGDSYAKELSIETHTDGCRSLKILELERKTQHKTGEFDGIISCSMCFLAFSDASYMDRHFKKMHNDQYWAQQSKAKTRNSSCKFIDGRNVTHSLNTGNKNKSFDKSLSSILQHGGQVHMMKNKSHSKNVILCNEEKNSTEAKDSPLSAQERTDFKVCFPIGNLPDTFQQPTKFYKGNTLYVQKSDGNILSLQQSEGDTLSVQRSEGNTLSVQRSEGNTLSVQSSENPNVTQSHDVLQTKEKPCKVVTFVSSDHLEKRKETQLGERPFKCDVCGVGFIYSGNLKTHKIIHRKEKPFRCDVCSAGFCQTNSLKIHKALHTGEKPFKCDVCGARFTQNDSLKIHKRMHTGEKPFKCDVCGARFTQNGNLKTHKIIHTGETPFKCDVCSAGFTQNGHLKTHKRIHTGEKPFKCDVCGAGFNQTNDLKRHKRMHSGEKPFHCDVCGAEFKENGSLKRHKRFHTGEMPYKCDVCCACFTRVDNLKIHKRIHTGESLSNVMLVV